MPTIEPRVIPDDYYSFSLKDLDSFLVAIERRIAAKEVMHVNDAAAFLGVSKSTLYKTKGLPAHKIEGLGIVYLRSELIDFIKAH